MIRKPIYYLHDLVFDFLPYISALQDQTDIICLRVRDGVEVKLHWLTVALCSYCTLEHTYALYNVFFFGHAPSSHRCQSWQSSTISVSCRYLPSNMTV